MVLPPRTKLRPKSGVVLNLKPKCKPKPSFVLTFIIMLIRPITFKSLIAFYPLYYVMESSGAYPYIETGNSRMHWTKTI